MKKITILILMLNVLCLFGQSPIVHYPFDGNANDASGNNYHATFVSATLTTDRFGATNKAYRFNGTSQIIKMPIASALKPDLPFSVSVWVQFEDLDQYKSAIFTNEHKEDFYSGYWLGVNNGKVHLSYGDGGDPSPSGRRTILSNTPINTNTWYHIIAVVRGPQDMELYVNPYDSSAQCNQCDLSNASWFYQGSGGSLFYYNGNYAGTFGLTDASDISSIPIKRFQGKIDDFKMWNRALSSSEIGDECNADNNTCGMIPKFTETINQCIVNFNGTNSGIVCPEQTHSWTVDGVAVNYSEDFTYEFPESGTYEVCYSICAPDYSNRVPQCCEKTCKTITVSCGSPDCCDIQPSFTTTQDYCDVEFDGIDNGTSCSNRTFKWKVDGVIVGNQEDLSYTFPETGLYEVCYTICSGNPGGGFGPQCCETYCQDVYVQCERFCWNSDSCIYIDVEGDQPGFDCTGAIANLKVNCQSQDIETVDWYWALGPVTYGCPQSFCYIGTNNGPPYLITETGFSGPYAGYNLYFRAIVNFNDNTTCEYTSWVTLECDGGGPGGLGNTPKSEMTTEIKLHPNPVSQSSEVYFDGIALDDIQIIEVYDIHGKKWLEIKPKSNRFTADGFKPGLYIVRFYTMEGVMKQKTFIVE